MPNSHVKLLTLEGRTRDCVCPAWELLDSYTDCVFHDRNHLGAEKFSTLAPHIDVEAIQTLLSDAPRVPPPRRHHPRGSFRTINLNREKGDWCCEYLDDLRHKHHFLHDYSCFFALQETDSFTTSSMNVPGHVEDAVICNAEFRIRRAVRQLRSVLNEMIAKKAGEVVCVKNRHQGSAAATCLGQTVAV